MSVLYIQVMKLLFDAIPTGDMFKKINEIFKELLNVCGIADDILM